MQGEPLDTHARYDVPVSATNKLRKDNFESTIVASHGGSKLAAILPAHQRHWHARQQGHVPGNAQSALLPPLSPKVLVKPVVSQAAIDASVPAVPESAARGRGGLRVVESMETAGGASGVDASCDTLAHKKQRSEEGPGTGP